MKRPPSFRFRKIGDGKAFKALINIELLSFNAIGLRINLKKEPHFIQNIPPNPLCQTSFNFLYRAFGKEFFLTKFLKDIVLNTPPASR
jgi:hypothetical protein